LIRSAHPTPTLPFVSSAPDNSLSTSSTVDPPAADAATPVSAVTLAGANRIVFIIVCLAQFMVVLDISIVNVALPSIQRDLHFSEANLQWVVTAYALTFGGLLLLGGRLADLFGRRRIFLLGLVLFTGASLLGGFANNQGTLIAARAL
jgi:MFS family permease